MNLSGRQIEASLEFYLTKDLEEPSAEISVKIKDIIAASTTISPAIITLQLTEDPSSDSPVIVDAGNSATHSFTTIFSESVYNLANSITCHHSTDENIQCTEQTCQISVTVTNTIPPGSDVTCDVTVTYSSHPFLGRQYSSSQTLLLGTTQRLSFDVLSHEKNVAIGTEVETTLELRVTEVMASVQVEVLCDNDNDNNFIISSMDVDGTDLTSTKMTEQDRDITEECGSVTLDFTVDNPSKEVVEQMVSVKITAILADDTANPTIMNFKATVDGEAVFDYNHEITICSPEFTITPTLISSSPYVSTLDPISYKSTIRNTGLCPFYLKGLVYDTSVDVTKESGSGMKFNPGEEVEFEYEIEKFPEDVFGLEPTLKVTVLTSPAGEYAAEISR